MALEYRVSQFSVEVLRNGPATARVSQFAAEVLRDGPAGARVSGFAVEVLRSVDSVTGRRRQAMAGGF